MARIELTITSDLFDNSEQQASIRENLPVRVLIAETQREFNLPDDAIYSMRVAATGKVLDPDKTLEMQGVQTGANLIFARERRAPGREQAFGVGVSRANLQNVQRAFFREDSTGKMFDIAFQPAIIGRPDHTNPASVDMLAVNLEPFEGAKSVSRYHARITEQRGQYFIESLADHNPAYLNDSLVRVGDTRVLAPGDRVRVGQITLTFGLRSSTTQYTVQPRGVDVEPSH